jgi:uncharacterized protein DUF2489
MRDRHAEAEMVDVARRMLDGELHPFEGVRKLSDLSRRLPVGEDLEAVIRTLQGIDSEIDDLPLGEARSAWAKDALAAKDRERDQYLERTRPEIENACRTILAHWSEAQKPAGGDHP